MQKYKKMDTKEVQSKKEKRKKRDENKDNLCSRKNIPQREKYISESRGDARCSLPGAQAPGYENVLPLHSFKITIYFKRIIYAI